MPGIKLDLDKGDEGEIKPVTIPLCMGWIKCENLIEHIEDAPPHKIHHQICKLLALSVHEIFDRICTNQDNPCPKKIWYCSEENWYYTPKKKLKK